MRSDRMERLLVLPFSIDCISDHSTSAISTTTQPMKPDSLSNTLVSRRKEKEEVEEMSKGTKMKRSSWGYLTLRRSFISRGIQKLISTLKSFSQLFVCGGEEQEEMKMEIGLPTDVKHVTHIGWDGSMSSNPVKGWEDLKSPELLSFPSISLRQFELAMAAQASTSVGLTP